MAVLGALGLIRDGHPVCPACEHAEDNSIPDGGGLKCFRATCPDTAPFFSNMGLVARAVLGTTDLAGTSSSAKANRRKVYEWLRERFPELPELRPARSPMLDAILASDVSEVSLGGTVADAESTTAANDTGDDAFSYTDDGNALAFVKAYLGRVIFVEEHDCFYVWSGSSWEKDKKSLRTIAHMRTLARKMFEVAVTIEDEKQRKRAVEHARKSQSERSIRAAVVLVKTDARIRLDADKLDANPNLLAVANGTIDLSSKPPKHRDHDPTDYITKVIPIEYDADATCPEFEKAVAATSDDPEVVRFRWRRFASCLDGHPDQYILIAWGLPGTGKTTLHEEIAAVLGPHAAKVPKSIFETTHHEQHPADLTTLEGKRFCYGAEIRPYLNIDRINELTGDASVAARGMAENWRTIRRTWKLAYYSNKKPVIRADPQNGIWRRTIFDPWTKKIGSPKAPDEVKAIFARERKGILARLVKAYADYQEQGLAPPPSVLAATTEFKKEQDTLKPFLDKHCDLTDKTVKTPFAVVWARYVEWATDLDPSAKPKKKRLALDLDAHGIPGETLNDRKKTDVRVGIKLRDVPVTSDADMPGMSASNIGEDEIEKLLDASERKDPKEGT
jgi:putative DNA primase/helicase